MKEIEPLNNKVTLEKKIPIPH